MMRLEVLELIQMQMQELDGAHLNSQLLDNDGQTVGKTTNMNELPDLTHLVDIEDITEAIQEIRILVSKRGMDNMLVGSLLSLPTAMLPLQDVNDTANFDSDHGPAKKRTLQIPELISMMETTTNALSSQVSFGLIADLLF